MKFKATILFIFAFIGAFAFPAMERDTIGPNETKINNIQPKSPAAPDWMLSTATNGKLKWVRSTRWKTSIGSSPVPITGWGNNSALFGRFFEMPDGSVWYVDYVGYGRKISVRPTPADRDWLEVTARTIPDSIGDAIFTYNYAGIGANYKWPGAELLVNDSVNYGVGIVQGNREARWGAYNSVLGTWADFQINGAQSQVALGPGVTDYTVMTAGGTVQQPSIPFSTLFNINTVSQNVTIPYYPSTRNDTSTATNFLYSNAAGVIQSGPLTEIIKPDILLGNGPYIGLPCNGYTVAIDTLGFDTSYYCNNGVFEREYQSRMVAPIEQGRYISTFGDSYTTGDGATIPAFSYINRFITSWGLVSNQQAVSGLGSHRAARRANQYMPLNHNFYVSMMAGLNDIRRSNSPLTLKKIETSTRVVIANAFLKDATPGSLIPGTGAWLNLPGTSSYMGGKADFLGGSAAYGDVNGLTKSYTFTGTNVVVGTFAADGTTFEFGTIIVTLDGHPFGTINFNGHTDGVTDGTYDNARITAVQVYTGLSNTTHTITLTTSNCIATTRPIYIDYVGTMKDPDHSSTVIVVGPPHLPAAGWATTAPNGSDERSDAAFLSMVEACKSFGEYPVVYTPSWLTLDGVSADNIHPNNLGHLQLAECMTNALYNGSQGLGGSSSSSSSALPAALNGQTLRYVTALNKWDTTSSIYNLYPDRVEIKDDIFLPSGSIYSGNVGSTELSQTTTVNAQGKYDALGVPSISVINPALPAWAWFTRATNNFGLGGFKITYKSPSGPTSALSDSTFFWIRNDAQTQISKSLFVGNGDIAVNHTHGIYWQANNLNDYFIARTPGAYTAPNYQQLLMKWGTGIQLDPGTLYGKSYVDILGGGMRVQNRSGVAATTAGFDINGKIVEYPLQSALAIGPFQTSTNTNGLSLTGSAISLHAASASTPGGVSVVQQTFGAGTGNKVFSSDNALQVKCDDVSGSKSAGIAFTELNNTVDLGNITVGGDATNSTMTMRIQDATNSTAYITVGSLNDNRGVKEKGGLYEDVKDVTTFPYTVVYGDRNIVVEPLNVGDVATLQKIGGSTGETKIGRVLFFHNIGTQILTIQPSAGDTIDGQVNQALGVNKSLRLVAITATQWAMHREF